MKISICIAFLLLIASPFVSSSNGQDETPAQSPDAPAQPLDERDDESGLSAARINLLNGSSIRGTIESIDQSGSVTGSGIPDGLTIDQVLSIQTSRKVDKNKLRLNLVLTDGSRIRADGLVIENDLVQFRSGCGLSQVKLESLRGVVWTDSQLVRDKLNSPSPDTDTVIAQSSGGARAVDGLLESVSAENVAINFRGESKTISIEKVQAIIVADLKLEPPTGTAAVVSMTDGSKIQGMIGPYDGTVLSIVLRGGNILELDSSRIADINIQSENLVYLSDLEPVNVEQKSSFTIERQWQRDLSVERNPMTLGYANVAKTASFAKGLGMPSFTRLDFENPGDFNRFRAVVGIDLETGGHGDCVVSVLGDGISLWNRRVRGSDDPVPVSVDISGLKIISIIVEPGEQFDLADHVDWGDARFTKSN